MNSLRFVILSCLLVLSACGFRPLYGNHSLSTTEAVREGLNAIDIMNIPDQAGQYLRNALMDRFYSQGRPGANARYKLDISPISESRTDLDVTKTSDTTRAQLRLATSLVLKDAEGTVLLERDLMAITSYNVLQSQFTTRVAEETARRNALDDLARQIEMQMLLYFNR